MIKNLKDLELNEALYNQIIELYSTFSQFDPHKFHFKQLNEFIQKLLPNHQIYVYLDEDKIVGAITLLIEHKIIHSGGKVGHIEDFVVLESHRSQGVGHHLITYAQNEAQRQNCYKVILDCASHLEAYYTKKGFTAKGTYMARYF